MVEALYFNKEEEDGCDLTSNHPPPPPPPPPPGALSAKEALYYISKVCAESP